MSGSMAHHLQPDDNGAVTTLATILSDKNKIIAEQQATIQEQAAELEQVRHDLRDAQATIRRTRDALQMAAGTTVAELPTTTRLKELPRPTNGGRVNPLADSFVL